MKTNREILLSCFTLVLIMFFAGTLFAEHYKYDAQGRLTRVIYNDGSSISAYLRANHLHPPAQPRPIALNVVYQTESTAYLRHVRQEELVEHGWRYGSRLL